MTGAFLDHLAETGNIAASARLIGVRPCQVYYRQRVNPAFAEAWRAALNAGMQTVKARLIADVLSGGDPAATASAAGAFDRDMALKLVTYHETRRGGATRPKGPVRRVATREESDAAILQRLATIAAAKARREREGA